jgi:hypothetical protein
MATDAKTGQPIFGRYNTGLHNVGSYQVAGWPWITGSAIADGAEHKLQFPTVTKSVTIIASGSAEGTMAGDLRVHFQERKANQDVIHGHHYISLAADNDSVTLNVKCKELYLTAGGANVGYEVFADLTNIPTASMYALTGAGVTTPGEPVLV